MIARALKDIKETVIYQGEIAYRGTLHQKLKVKIGSGSEYTLFIDKASGLISKMARQHPSAGEISYAFSNHRKSDGVSFAQDLYFTVGGQTRLVSVMRNIKVNPQLEEAFQQPTGFTNWGELVSSSKLTVHKLAPNVYHAGKDRSFTLFVDTGDYFIASGGHQGLKESFQAVKDFAGVDKPLNYMISTHHHNEHLPALNEAVELGAKLVTVNAHVAAIERSLSKKIIDKELTLVTGKASLGNGAVEIYDIATMHADNYLLVYVPAAKLIFAEDHYETQLKTALPRVHKDMVIFREAVEALGIDVETLIDGHTPRQLTINEFQTATDAYRDIICPAGFSICATG